MCHGSCLKFGSTHLTKSICSRKKILEVGSLDINGSIRNVISKFSPGEYTGVDIASGKGVDSICSADKLISTFGKNFFDIVIATELLEHTYFWKSVISNIKGVCRPKGYILITTRSRGFPYHPYPSDYWRFEISDFKTIFSDLKIIELRKDPQAKGVFIFAQKPFRFTETKLPGFTVFKIKKPQ